MFTHSNKRICRTIVDYHEIQSYNNEAITLMLDLMYEELNLGGKLNG